jgi:hypothetical protein
MSTPYPTTPTPYPAAPTQIPSPEPRPLVAPWPVVLGLGVGIPAAIGAALGASSGYTPEERSQNALLIGARAGAFSVIPTLLGMLHDYIITKATKKRTALQTIVAYGVPHLAHAPLLFASLPLFVKQSSANPPVEEPAPLATEWYKPILIGMGIMTPIGAIGGYAHEGPPGAVIGSLAGALAGVTAGMKGMVLDYLVTKIRGKRGPIQNAIVYSLPYALFPLRGLAVSMASQYR